MGHLKHFAGVMLPTRHCNPNMVISFVGGASRKRQGRYPTEACADAAKLDSLEGQYFNIFKDLLFFCKLFTNGVCFV